MIPVPVSFFNTFTWSRIISDVLTYVSETSESCCCLNIKVVQTLRYVSISVSSVVSRRCSYLSKPLLLQVEHPLFPDVLLHDDTGGPPPFLASMSSPSSSGVSSFPPLSYLLIFPPRFPRLLPSPSSLTLCFLFCLKSHSSFLLFYLLFCSSSFFTPPFPLCLLWLCSSSPPFCLVFDSFSFFLS